MRRAEDVQLAIRIVLRHTASQPLSARGVSASTRRVPTQATGHDLSAMRYVESILRPGSRSSLSEAMVNDVVSLQRRRRNGTPSRTGYPGAANLVAPCCGGDGLLLGRHGCR